MSSKTPSQVADEYLTHLKGLKPDVDVSLTDSDWWVKAQAQGGAMAGIYADQDKLSNDPFPQSARHDALAKHLKTYFAAPNDVFTPAQPSIGTASVTGAIGTTIDTNLQFLYQPNGNSYQSTTGFIMSATAALIPVQSIGTGQNQNLLSGAALFIPAPPAGLNANAVAAEDFRDGRDIESDEQAAARILSFIQTPPAGGTEADYVRFCQESDPSVVSVSVLRFASGFGTVALVITAGTTDIDAAIDSGAPVIVIPSDELIDTVQTYVDSHNPITDCATVYPPTPIDVDVTVRVRFSQGDSTTILPGQTLTQAQLVQREVQRAIYKTPAGGRKLGASGYMVCSDIEETIDAALSNEPFATGSLPILDDRQVDDLSATGANLLMLGTQVAIPGTILIVES